MKTDFRTIDAYIATFSPPIQALLQQVRAMIREAAPDASETISYQIPTFTLHGNLVHFAAFKAHLGMYPPVRAPELLDAVAPYANAKGNLRFPLDQPLPLALIARIVAARVRENRERAEARAAKKRGRRAGRD